MKNSELKQGMWVVCLPDFNRESNWHDEKSGGAGWEENKMFKIRKFTDENRGLDKQVAWPEGDYSGVFCQALRLATQQEIETGIVNVKNENYEIY